VIAAALSIQLVTENAKISYKTDTTSIALWESKEDNLRLASPPLSAATQLTSKQKAFQVGTGLRIRWWSGRENAAIADSDDEPTHPEDPQSRRYHGRTPVDRSYAVIDKTNSSSSR
ncbi:hypothetical protein FOZ62_021559, partial [Perkinsus olseni]